MAITEQQVKDALQTLVDPNTHKDYVTSKSARNIKVDGNNVSLDVQLGYPAKSQVTPIREEITAKLKTLPDVGNVVVNVTMNIVKHAVHQQQPVLHEALTGRSSPRRSGGALLLTPAHPKRIRCQRR